MNPDFIKWLEEQEYDFNYVGPMARHIVALKASWFIKSVHDSIFPTERYKCDSYPWSKVLTNNFVADE